MLDRFGRVIVDNYPSFSVLLLRDDPQQVERLLPQIAEGLDVTLDDIKQQMEAATSLPHFQPIVIKPEASAGDIAFIESHRADIPVLEMLMVHRRRYPHGGFMAHASGYVGEVSSEQIEESGGRYKPGDIVGKAGLERQYNDHLMGVDGMRRSVVNSVGREVGRLEQTDAVPGKPIRLTIDYDLQLVAEEALVGQEGREWWRSIQRRVTSWPWREPAFVRSQRFRDPHIERRVATIGMRIRSGRCSIAPSQAQLRNSGIGFQNFNGYGHAGIEGAAGLDYPCFLSR